MKNNLKSNLKDVARITVDDIIPQCRCSPAEYTFDSRIIQNAKKPPTDFDDDEGMISDQGFEVGELGTSIDSNAWEHAVAGNYEDALSLFRIAADIKRSTLSNKDVGLAMTINSAGNAHFQRGNVPKAAELYEEAYHIVMKANSGGKDTRIAAVLCNLAATHEWACKYENAIVMYKKALSIQEASYGPNHADVAGTINNLGMVNEKMGNYSVALELYRQALDVYEIIKDDGNVYGADIAGTLTNIGNIHSKTGSFDEAMELYLHAVTLKTESQGPEGSKKPEIAGLKNNIGILCIEREEYTKAVELFTEALKLQRETLGLYHLDVASTLHNMAEVYMRKKQVKNAITVYNSALNVKKKVLGSKHIDVGSLMFFIGGIYKKTNDLKKAKTYLTQAQFIFKVAGMSHLPDAVETEILLEDIKSSILAENNTPLPKISHQSSLPIAAA